MKLVVTEEALVAAADALKISAALEHVPIGAVRARRVVKPVLEAALPYFLGLAKAAAEAPPARKSVSRSPKLAAVVERLDKAVKLHDLSDVPVAALPADLGVVMAAYADCQQHLAKAVELVRQLATLDQEVPQLSLIEGGSKAVTTAESEERKVATG